MTTSGTNPVSQAAPTHNVAPTHILVLGGAADARALMNALQAAADIPVRVTLSMAGRTRNPASQQAGVIAVTQRVGGFGGAEGLAAFLRDQKIAGMIDATHPFAAQMSANAVAASGQTGVPLLGLVRPAWQAAAGDDWRSVADIPAAVAALGAEARRVFLAIGRQNLRAFMTAPQHAYLARTIEPADADVDLPHVEYIHARGPFALADELELLAGRRIDVLVTKNSGGSATFAKLAAARELGLPVVMIDRPPSPGGQETDSVPDALAWLRQLAGQAHGLGPSPAERGE